ncbi:hypothetical protein [Corynebacterium jeikeium]|uniref:hypothetical protein n=1 Tax=Corynebacterium jeikeium TaxID=38289 RepID=UPI00054F526E|nr:hypothetical protein [Corynebacterium jeikeium]
MTSNQQRLEELQQQAKTLAEQIEQLEDQLNNTPPTTGLLGRWATNRHGKQVLITTDRPVDGWIETTYVNPDGTTSEKAEQFDSLSFPEQTTRPEDVPVGEAWLLDAHNGFDTQPNTPALKITPDLWVTPTRETADESEWHNYEITLITPLIPARPQDMPETVTTHEEYEALPEGSIVAAVGDGPWIHLPYVWMSDGGRRNNAEMAGRTRHVLRRGWGE